MKGIGVEGSVYQNVNLQSLYIFKVNIFNVFFAVPGRN
jgi:hypothetical protein